jgi:outer membrane lipopolysaccharide assembly protein LptE/RlpB
MKKPMTLPLDHTGIVTVTFLCLFLLIGCGYQMVGRETHIPPGLTSIAIPTFVNKTLEPGIEIPFTQAFLREFILDQRVNVVDRSEAESVLEGVIKSFSISSVAYDRSGLVLEYKATVIMDAKLKKRTGETLWIVENLKEIQWYRTSSHILASEANKEKAIQQIGRFVAGRIRNRLFYNF